MEVIVIYFGILGSLWLSLEKGLYSGILYGLIHKKITTKIGADRFQPYLYKNKAVCRGWGLIINPGIFFLTGTYAIYINIIKQAKIELYKYYYIIYTSGYATILFLSIYGLWWIYIGIKFGIIEKKTKTYYHLQNGEKYYLHHTSEKERTISKHRYFRGKKAVQTGIVRVGLGSAYILVALLLFIDRDYYIGSAQESIYSDIFKKIKVYYQDTSLKERTGETQEYYTFRHNRNTL
jgi:hypothetical protein